MKRNALALLLAIIILLFSSVLSVIDVKGEENSWATLAPMSTPSLDAAVVDEKIYALGGTSNVNEEYDSSTNTWTTKTPVPTGRSALATVTVENKIYAIGGYDNEHPGTPTAKNEVYDPATDTWANKAEMPTARGKICANAVNGQIYVMGGFEMTRPLYVEESKKNEVYDPTTNTWALKAEMPYAAVHSSSVVVGDQIYVLTSPIQIYDTETDSWSLGSSPPKVQSGADAVTVLDTQGCELIYIIGGEDPSGGLTFFDLVQIYDPQNDVWDLGEPMPTPRVALAVAVLNNQIYALGGVTYGEYLGDRLSTNERYTPESAAFLPTPTPTPTSSPIPEPEPFPIALIVASLTIGGVVGVGVGLLFYFKKRKH